MFWQQVSRIELDWQIWETKNKFGFVNSEELPVIPVHYEIQLQIHTKPFQEVVVSGHLSITFSIMVF